MNPQFDLNQLQTLPSEQLVSLIVQQQQIIEQLQQEVERLKAKLQLDSQTSSKPPSTDLLKKPKKPVAAQDKTTEKRRKPGGQPGHPGSTRKGFGRVDQLRAWVKLQPQVQVDESPWPVLGLKEWLWVTAGEKFCLFHAGDTRSRAELVEQLGESFDGVISSDDYSVYNGYKALAQQKCLAHLRRHFKKILKLNHGNNPALGQTFIDLIDEAFAQHQKWRETQDHSTYHTWAVGFKLRVALSIQQWLALAGYEAGKLLRSLRDKAEQWWYFLDHPQVPPDNNLAERELRLAVTKRKVSGGSRSMKRFQETADLLSVVQTCRRQERSVLEFFQAAMIAHSHGGEFSPSLLPEPIP
ncbi:MAG TPA: IS66 family transposase [Coleofasciculaceae cyanobacterium]